MSKIGKTLGALAVGTVVAIGADSSVANSLYDVLRLYMHIDPYNMENFVRAAGTFTALAAGTKLLYHTFEKGIEKFTSKASKIPIAGALFGVSGLAALLADTNVANSLYDALYLTRIAGIESLDFWFKNMATGGAIFSGLATMYYCAKRGIERIVDKFSKEQKE